MSAITEGSSYDLHSRHTGGLSVAAKVHPILSLDPKWGDLLNLLKAKSFSNIFSSKRAKPGGYDINVLHTLWIGSVHQILPAIFFF